MIKQHKPVTPGMRHKISLSNKYTEINKKKLTISTHKTGGRNITGKITTRHIGGGHKQRLRILDNLGDTGSYSKIRFMHEVHDPFHTGSVGLFKTLSGKEFLRLIPEQMNKQAEIAGKFFQQESFYINGTVIQLKKLAIGTKIFNIQSNPNNKTQIAKAGGTFAIIVKQEPAYTTIKLPSKKTKVINNNFICTVGSNGNSFNNKKILGKAGVSRWLGIRPTVRGEAMNPRDHPHGGETSGGVRLKTIYGKLAKFVKSK